MNIRVLITEDKPVEFSSAKELMDYVAYMKNKEELENRSRKTKQQLFKEWWDVQKPTLKT